MNLGGTVHVTKKGLFVLFALCLVVFYYFFSNRIGTKEDARINLRRLLAVAIRAAESGGKEVVGHKDNLLIQSKGKTKEGANDSVTNADLRSHCVMVDSLSRPFPDLRVISEESKTVCSESGDYSSAVLDSGLRDEWVDVGDVTVWIDPLDATQEYTEKLYEYVTTMVCVAVKGEPIIGVIHKPFVSKTFWAWKGKGYSFENTLKESGEQLRFIVSRSHSGKVAELVKQKFSDRKFEIISAGGAGYKVLELVNGNADMYLHVTAIKKWDICAGNAILNALGGRMVTMDKNAIGYADPDHVLNENGLIATLKENEALSDKL
ncbi:hypothetical protein PPYR_14513 [Photinus pyralis]|uniref:Putative inositol monophosphatase 3 n=1 Tax=Photinus pyralis TaxID=7054 RepID=A0A5N4A5D8_PHOPY|nr:putative inositol monophosphatase 3 [Photinus pyralis]KAB0792554.1 hypothetical protein PPYR_14513 [Photinus pyralis]